MLLSGFEDVVLLNAQYEQETAARVEAQLSVRDANSIYLSLVDTLTVGVIRKDINGMCLFANKMACQILGRRIEEIVGKYDAELFRPEVAEYQRAFDYRVMETGEIHEECLAYDTLHLGNRYFNLRASPVWSSVSEIVGTQTTWSDVTELKHAEAELLRAKTIAEEASLAKSQFLSAMSHELRTPLNGVIGMTELLSGTDLSATQHQYVDACRNSGKLLLQVIDHILDFSKIECGKMELDLHEFDLEQLVADTVDAMAWSASQKSLELSCDIDLSSWTKLKGDSHRLQQILVNLIGNAIKFTDAGEVVVKVKTELKSDDSVRVRFSVSDTGIGILPDKLCKLFQAFSQVDMCTTRNYGGTGLGLAISKSLVDLMNGTMGVVSKTQEGSTFWFELPLDRVPNAVGHTSDQAQLAGMRALIVDDNETNRLILSGYSSSWGVASVTAASVAEALAEIENATLVGSQFDIILTDYNMPHRDGLELCQAIKQYPHHVVLLLGSTDICLGGDEMRAHGIDAILRKPLRRQELYDVLCNALDSASKKKMQHTSAASPPTDEQCPAGHILVAEDNDINIMYIRELIKLMGCTCAVAKNGHEALKAVQHGHYDLVLMDCQMPEMDGFEATRRIRQLESDGGLKGHLPIVALTANALSDDRARCLKAGMDEYISKPVQQGTIKSIFTRFLNCPGKSGVDVANAEDTDILQAAPIDAEALLRRCFGKLEFTQSLLDHFESEGLKRVREIQKHASERHAVTVADLAHALRGAAGILCANAVQELAASVEQAGRSSDFDAIAAEVGILAAEMGRCIEYMPQLRQRLLMLNNSKQT